MAGKRKTVTRKKKAPKQKWRWIFLKFLLLVGCIGLAGFLGLVTFLNGEAQRLGIFQKVAGQESAPTKQAVVQKSLPVAPAASGEDYTMDEKQQLEAILESQGGH